MRRVLQIASALLLVFSLTGCGMTFVYNNLSLLTPWLVDDFISFNSDQKKAYQTHLKTLHQWHRQNELPEYRQLLESILKDLDKDALNTDNFGEHIFQMRRRWEVLVQQAIPAMTEMALTLSEKQVEELLTKLEKSNQERLKESEDMSFKDRQRRLLGNIKDWMGKLSDEQTTLIHDYVTPENQDARLTVAAHRRFQERLGEVLKQRQADDFKPQFAAILADPLDSEEGTALNEYRRVNFNQRIELYSRLWVLATDKQKSKVRKKIQGYIDDIDTLVAKK